MRKYIYTSGWVDRETDAYIVLIYIHDTVEHMGQFKD